MCKFIPTIKELNVKKLYDIAYHHGDDGLLLSCTVEEITLLEERPKQTILAKTAAGDIFSGSLEDYYDSEEDAAEDLIADLDNCIISHREEIEKLKKRNTYNETNSGVF